MSAPTAAGRSTIKFGQAVIQPVTFTPPSMDYSFFKKPVSTDVPAPQKGWGAPSASSSPLLKEPHTLPPDTLDTTKPLTDLAVLIEDDDNDDDRTFTPHKMDSSKIKDVLRSSKWWGSPPAKKAQTIVWWPKSQNHAKHPIHCGMNGIRVNNPGRDWSTKRCVILHLPQLWSWST